MPKVSPKGPVASLARLIADCVALTDAGVSTEIIGPIPGQSGRKAA